MTDKVEKDLAETPLPPSIFSAVYRFAAISFRGAYLIGGAWISSWLQISPEDRGLWPLVIAALVIATAEAAIEKLRSAEGTPAFLKKAEAGARLYSLLPPDVRPHLRGKPWKHPEEAGWSHLRMLAEEDKLQLYAKWGPTTIIERLEDPNLDDLSLLEESLPDVDYNDKPFRVLVRASDLPLVALRYRARLNAGWENTLKLRVRETLDMSWKWVRSRLGR